MGIELWNLENVQLGHSRSPRLAIHELSIPSGVTAVIGPSGAGKTSLLNLLVEFESPDRGEVRASDSVQRESKRRLGVGWVPADFGLWPLMSVRDHLQLVSQDSQLTSTNQKSSAQTVDELLQTFDLSHLGERTPDSLSMGERARLAVARSLAMQPFVHVMDEPFTHVDPERVDLYWRVLREALKRSGSSLIFSTHSPSVVLREADFVICIQDGQVAWSGPPHELYYRPENKSLANLLGPVNWFTSDEQSTWLSAENGNQCLRPEQVALQADDSSPLSVEKTWNVGQHHQSEIQHRETNEVRTIYHQPSSGTFASGTRVRLSLMLFAFLSLLIPLLSGCGQSDAQEPELAIRSAKMSPLPNEGPMLPAPRGMTFSPRGDLFILDDAGRVLMFDQVGDLVRKWWMPEYDVGKPEGAWVLLDGRIAVADTHYNRITFFNVEGELLGTLGEFGRGPGQFIYTVAVTQNPDGFLYVAEYGGNDRVQKFTHSGEFVTEFGEVGTENGQFQRPSGLVWHEGTLYVADAINNRIQAFDPDGKFLRVVADAQTAGLYYPYDLAKGPDGSLFVAEYGAGRISRISTDGKVLGRYGHEGRGEGQFWTPWGIAVNHDGKIAVADTGNRRVVELQY
ncbi:ATP-binding cassette domain-containing protein [Thalassoglobus sp. JC818]|uniref:ATP-binding cassette domain-containing protein n=1 Tax=Thalassoglobus sp. JC818 TaxID=3232136 RepID=UPI003457E433